MEFIKASEPYGSNNYAAFTNSVTNDKYFGERIEGFILIQFGSVNTNQKKSIDLEAKGLQSPISLKSIYTFAPTTTNDEIKFRIFRPDALGNLDQIAYQRFTNNDMPYFFPPGAILDHRCIIEVEPRVNADNIIIYAKPVDILYSIEAD